MSTHQASASDSLQRASDAPGWVRKARIATFAIVLVAILLPWGVHHSNLGGVDVNIPLSGLVLLTFLAFISLGVLALPTVGPLVIWGLALVFTRSRLLHWLYRFALAVMFVSVTGIAIFSVLADFGLEFSLEAHLRGRWGLYVCFLGLCAAVGIEIYDVTRRRMPTAWPAVRYEGDLLTNSPAETLSRRSCVASMLHGVAALGAAMLLIASATAFEILDVPWDLHFYLTVAVTTIGGAAFYVWALVLALNRRSATPPGEQSLRGAIATHSASQVAVGVSVFIMGAPLTEVGPAWVPPSIGSALVALIWFALLALAVGRWIVPRRASLVMFLSALLWIGIAAHPFLMATELHTPLMCQEVCAVVGWGAMQILSLIGLARAVQARVKPRWAVAVAVLPAALGSLAFLIGYAALHVGVASRDVRWGI